MSLITVFLGPSLPNHAARKILDADIRGPVQQGDVLRAVDAGASAIAIIDGIFRDAPTVRHREILWALSKGVPVFGASSMGALRAAELHTHGMIGVGLIYRWYRRFQLSPDDAVAVTHAPEALGFTPLNDALIDIRRSLQRARRAGAIDQVCHAQLVEIATGLPFEARRLLDLDKSLAPYKISQKALDASALLRLLAEHQLNADWPIPQTPQPPIVHAWLDDLVAGDIDPNPYKNTKKVR